MLRRLACLGPLAATVLLGLSATAAEPGSAPDPTSGPGLGRLWQPPPGPDPDGERARHQLARNRVNVVKLGLAAAGAGLLLWGALLARAGRPDAHRRLRDGLLAALGAAALLGWWNFLHFHYPGFVHANNTFVYYVGSKYFPELGYTRLYECTAVADLRAGLRARVVRRRMTDLESYELGGTRRIVAEPERCTRHFSKARWAAFERDVAWFRSHISADDWEGMQRDHGYNPPPSWGLLGSLLARTGPASAGQILALTLLDSLLDLAAWACALWAFGWRALCVALLYWGTNHIAEFSWTGGSFLRDDWLAASVVGIGLLRRGYPLGAGFLLGYASLLRVFPALALAGVAGTALLGMLRRRRVGLRREHRRLALGAVLAAALVLPLSSLVAGGFAAWGDFARNTRLHVGTPASNLVGLRTVVSYDPGARLVDLAGSVRDPSAAWKEARLEAFAARRIVYALLVVGYLLLLGRALVGQPAWVAAILGLGALPVLLEPTCYYTSVLAVFGFLWLRRQGIGVALCALSAASWLVAAGFREWDDVFFWSSLPLLAFVGYATAVARAPARGQEA